MYLQISPTIPYKNVLSIFKSYEHNKYAVNITYINLILKFLLEFNYFRKEVFCGLTHHIIHTWNIQTRISGEMFRSKLIVSYHICTRSYGDADIFLPHSKEPQFLDHVGPDYYCWRKWNIFCVSPYKTKYVLKPFPNN